MNSFNCWIILEYRFLLIILVFPDSDRQTYMGVFESFRPVFVSGPVLYTVGLFCHILKDEFFYLGRFGSQGSKGEIKWIWVFLSNFLGCFF